MQLRFYKPQRGWVAEPRVAVCGYPGNATGGFRNPNGVVTRHREERESIARSGFTCEEHTLVDRSCVALRYSLLSLAPRGNDKAGTRLPARCRLPLSPGLFPVQIQIEQQPKSSQIPLSGVDQPMQKSAPQTDGVL